MDNPNEYLTMDEALAKDLNWCASSGPCDNRQLIADLRAKIQRLQSENTDLRCQCEWTPVEEGLPEPNRQLIITVRREFTGATVVCKNPATMTRAGEWRFRGGGKVLLEKRGIVVAWRYWPVPYQPKESE